MKKELFFDLETTGLSTKLDGIQQIACIYCEDGEEIDSIDFNVNTFSYQKDIRKPSEVALEITGRSEEEIKTFLESRKAFVMFRGWLSAKINKYDKKDKCILIGYNSGNFDIPFLRSWWKDNGDKYFGSFFFNYDLDVFYLVKEAYFNNFFLHNFGKNPKNLKLGTIARFLDITIIEHDAISDIEATREIYNYLQKNFLKGNDGN